MRTTLLLAVIISCALWSGCSDNTASQGNANAPVKNAKATPAPTPTPSVAAEETPKSVFNVDRTARDPFFPNARQTVVEASPGDMALDIPAILQANLHGIISSGEKSIAYVSNVMLEPGRIALIPIRAGGQERQVTVRCREVTKDAVILEVQGYPEPVRLSRVAR